MPTGGEQLEGVRQKLEATKISPDPQLTKENPYVDILSLRLEQCYKKGPCPPPLPIPPSSYPRQPCSNPYVDELQQSLGDSQSQAQLSEPNTYITQLDHM